jgi:outer membrane immunogenic protein
MSFMLRCVVCLPTLFATGIALAADIPPPYTPPPPLTPVAPAPTVFSWTGYYVGATAGFGWAGDTIDNEGWIAGGYAGANLQLNSNIVIGLEGDFTFTGKEGTSGTTTVSNPWNTTLRGRVGYAFNRLMIYGTAGVAVGRLEVDDTVGPTSEEATRVGWTAGAGVEAALTDNIIGRLEYRFTDLGSETFAPGSISYSSHDVMAGISFKF